MDARNGHWYNLNSTRNYPLDDKASARSDEEEFLPQDILADLRLMFPRLSSDVQGELPFLSSLTLTSSLVTATFQAAYTAGNEAQTLMPLGAITVPLRDLVLGRPYSISPHYPGVGGWVVFGSGVHRGPWQGRFSTPAQGLLTPKAVRWYTPLPVESIRRIYGQVGLTGLVSLVGEPPLEVVKVSRTVYGFERDVIVIRLIASPTEVSSSDAANTLRQFAGPCGGRPDSRTCGSPEPIEFINSVGPDCSGVVELDFRGCTVVGRNRDDCGLVIDCNLGFSETCAAPYLPDGDGYLPAETPGVSPEPAPRSLLSRQLAPQDELDEPDVLFPEEEVVGELPYYAKLPQDFFVAQGEFVLEENEAGDRFYASSGSRSVSLRNLAICRNFDVSTLSRRATVELKLQDGPAGSKQNGGLAINVQNVDNSLRYYLAEVDYAEQRLKLLRWNGKTSIVLATLDVPGLPLKTWLTLSVDTRLTPRGATLTLRLQWASFELTLGPFLAHNYFPGDGAWGLSANRAITQFRHFQVAELA